MTPRRWTILTMIAAVIIMFPLRLAFTFAAPEGVAAQKVTGLLWSGHAQQLQVGSFALGTVKTGVSPLALLTGRIALPFERIANDPGGPLSGKISMGLGGQRIENLNGNVALRAAGSLPLSGISVSDFSLRLTQDGCYEAQGQVQVIPAVTIPGVDLRNGLSGNAKCENGQLLLPLASASGKEKLTIRIRRNGQYHARLTIPADTPDMAQMLVAAGFAAGEGGFGLELTGRF